MADYILLMHDDASAESDDAAWEAYLTRLRASGCFDGGSSVGAGDSYRKYGVPASPTEHLIGFLRVRADSLQSAMRFLEGNPVYEVGGTVEIRELPTD